MIRPVSEIPMKKWWRCGGQNCVLRPLDPAIQRAIDWAATVEERVVLKPWDGNGGRGVLVSRHGDANLRSMLGNLTENESQHILVQRYIPEITQGDKRIILIDGDPVGWMMRVPQPGDHRGNMHVGATVESCVNSRREIVRFVMPLVLICEIEDFCLRALIPLVPT